MKSLHLLSGLLLALLTLPVFALSAEQQAQLQQIQTRWAEINYQLPATQREQAFARLASDTERALQASPAATELRIWHAIVLSTWAGAKGGLGALSLVKQAKGELEQALQEDDQALQGSAYTSLASLYYQVPGWPIGFGDEQRAAELFQHALRINPQGLDPNYFYGDFLLRQKRYAAAHAALSKALAAADRPGRQLADAGRRAEARALLAQVQEKMK